MAPQEMYQFIKNCKKNHLTIEDLKKLKPGDELDVLIWDSDFEEYWIRTNATSEKAYWPEIFFKENRHKLTFLRDNQWDIHFSFGETIRHPIHLNVSNLETNWTWYGLDTDGKIHITSEIITDGEIIPKEWKPKHIHWTEFAETTRIGWRGPIMLWKKLKDLSHVYYKETAGQTDGQTDGDE